MKRLKALDSRLKTQDSRLSRLMSHVLCLVSCVFLLCVSSVVCDAQQATAVPQPDGEIELTWPGGAADIYRDTAPLEGLDLADIADRRVAQGESSPWADGDTTDGTGYYYRIEVAGGPFFVQAVADKSPPFIENIAALPSPFSPDGDRIEDSTRIFFTLTEPTFVTLSIYRPDPGDPDNEALFELVRTILDGSAEFPPGDNFAEWDGRDDSAGAQPNGYAPEGRYIYRFDVSDPADTDLELLQDKDPPKDINGSDLPRTRDTVGNLPLQNISGDVWILLVPFEIKDVSVTPTPFSPDGDKVRDTALIDYVIVDPSDVNPYVKDYDVDEPHAADYVAGNIFAVQGGEQIIVASIYKERLAYYWDMDNLTWVGYHVRDGIPAGLSSEHFYEEPINPSDQNTPWRDVPFTLEWNGSGAIEGVTTYIARLEAGKYNGAKTLPKTHEIIIEWPSIVPNDKQAPLVEWTFPIADSTYSAQLTYVQAYLSDGQGTGVDLANSTIYLIGPAGELIPGQQSNDGRGAITRRLHEPLSEDGSDDGTYTIVVSAIDYAKNRSGELQFQFEYDMGTNDQIPPYVDGLPAVFDMDGVQVASIEEDGSTIIELIPPAPPAPDTRVPIDSIRVRGCDDGSGIKLLLCDASLFGPEGQQINAVPLRTPDEDCVILQLELDEPLPLDSGDGQYTFVVKLGDKSDNEREFTYRFTYRTRDVTLDDIPPMVDAVELLRWNELSESWTVLDDDDSGPPFSLGPVLGPVDAIRASVSDSGGGEPSSGIRLEDDRSYIDTGYSGDIGYTGSRMEDGIAYAYIVFTLTEGLTDEGNYSAVIAVEDYAENSSGEVTARFMIRTTVDGGEDGDDTQPPVVTDVEAFGPVGQVAGPICLRRNPYAREVTSVGVTLEDDVSGVNTDISDIQLIEPPVRLLFSIQVEADIQSIVNGLDSGTMPIELQAEFEDEDIAIPLSDNITVLTEEEDLRWLITDWGPRDDPVDGEFIPSQGPWRYTIRKEFRRGQPPLEDPDQLYPLLGVYERHTVPGELAGSRLILSVPLGINGWYTLDVFSADNVRTLLPFVVDLSGAVGDLVLAELDNRIVPDQLRTGLGLSPYATVSVKERGCKWLIIDQGQGQLDVYRLGGCRWRTIEGQGAYIVEREVDSGTLSDRLDVYQVNNSETVHIPDAFFLDNTPPVIESVEVLRDGTPVHSGTNYFNAIMAYFTENGSGIDYRATSIALRHKDGGVVPGSLILDQENQTATWLLQDYAAFEDVQDLDYDLYTVEVRTRDMAGNETAAIEDFRSIFTSESSPELVTDFVFPEDGEILNDVVDKVTVTVVDESGAGIDFENTSIRVSAPSTAPDWWRLMGSQEVDAASGTLTWDFKQSLPTDGRGDGEYEVRVRITDRAGGYRRVTGSFIYDTQPPYVVKVEIGARPWVAGNYEPISELEAGGTNRQLNRADVKLEDEWSSIDLSGSSVNINGPGISSVAQSDDGIDTLVMDFPTLSAEGEDDGVYQIEITASDELGNQNDFPYIYTFIYDTQPPEVEYALAFSSGDIGVDVESLPEPSAPIPIYGEYSGETPVSDSLVLTTIDSIEVKLSDAGVGVDVIASADNLFVQGPHGMLEGKRDAEGDDTLVFRLDEPLSATDPTDDGTYTVRFTAVDRVGNQEPVEFTFEYKARAPVPIEVELVTTGGEVLSLLTGETTQFERSVAQVRAVLEDRSGKGLDFDASYISVQGPGVSDQDVVDNNGVDTIVYTFAEPFANDGSDDGEYAVRIRAVDKDGYWIDYGPIVFFFDTTPAEVVEVRADGSVINQAGTVLNEPISEVSAKLSDVTTEVDLFGSSMSLSGPVAITATQVNNGVDTIALRFFELPSNGTADGRYEISVTPADVLGNMPAVPFEFSFIYDTEPPELVSTDPPSGETVSLPVGRVTAVLNDGGADEAAGVDLNTSSLSLIGPDGTVVSGELQRFGEEIVGGRTQGLPLQIRNWDWRLSSEQDTPYYIVSGEIENVSDTLKEDVRVNVSSYDADGGLINTKSSGLDRPVVPENIPPGGTANFSVWLESVGGEESFKVRVFYYDTLEEKEKLGGEAGDGGEEELFQTLTFVLESPLDVDGTDDGTYTIVVVTRDLIGNESAPILRNFTYVTKAPTWLSTTPADGEKLRTPVASVTATLMDSSGAGLDLENSRVTLIDPDGEMRPGSPRSQEPDTVSFILDHPLATDTTDDGIYTLDIVAADKLGTVVNYRTNFIYDRIPPLVKLTSPADGDMLKESIESVSATLFDSGSGVDLEDSTIELIGPAGNVIAGSQVNDGVDTIKWKTAAPIQVDGQYTIRVVPMDEVGNVPLQAQTFSFIYDVTAPVVSRTEPVEGSTVILALDRVSAQLDDGNGTGPDLAASTIQLKAPNGRRISGVKTVDEQTGSILYTFPPLATNGTADGEYTIELRLVDLAGNSADEESTFQYSSLAPVLVDIEAASDREVISLSGDENRMFERPVIEVRAILEDRSGTGIDLEKSTIEIEGPGVSSQDMVEGRREEEKDIITYIFEEPLANDGSDDGEYMIGVRGVDNDGHSAMYFVLLAFDCTPPEVEEVKAGEYKIRPYDAGVVTFNKPISEVTAKLSDAMTQVDLVESNIALEPKTLVRGSVSIHEELVHNGVDTIIARFSQLSENGTADGLYEVSVKPMDTLGNGEDRPALIFPFIYDTTAPEVDSTEPSSGEVVTIPVEKVVAVVSDGNPDATAGVDLDACSLALVGPDGERVDGELQRERGMGDFPHLDTLTLILGSPLASDGSEDGTYTIEIVTQDQVGNASAPVSVKFIYATRSPTVSSTTPADGAKLRIPVSHVTVTLMDNSGAGLDLGKSKVTLIDPDGEMRPGSLSSQEPDTVVLTLDNALATDNTDDGLYTLDILAVDKTGVSASYMTTFTYDTVPPLAKLTSPADGDMLKESIESVSAQLEDDNPLTSSVEGDGSGVDLEGSVIELIGPEGSVTGSQVNNGVDTIFLRFNVSRFTTEGRYTISVIPKDKVGNVSADPQNFSFIYDVTAPIVSRTEPAAGSTVVVPLDRVSVELDDGDGTGPDLEASVIKLKASDGSEIAGEKTVDEKTVGTRHAVSLLYTFPPLAVDGSANGEYTISVETQDKAGNRGSEYEFKFNYLPTAPSVAELTPEAGSFLSYPVEHIVARLEDKSGTGIDLSNSHIKLLNPSGQEVAGETSDNGIDTLELHLQNLFATDNTDDGEYTVEIKAVDNNGNEAIHKPKFYYDTTPCTVLAAYVGDAKDGVELKVEGDEPTIVPSDFGPVNRVSAVIRDAGVGVDLELSGLSVEGAAAEEGLEGRLYNNGVDTIGLEFDEITTDGVYTVIVTPIDKLWNAPLQGKSYSFMVDTLAPKISASTPADGSIVVNRRLSKLSVQLDDGAGSGIDGEMLEMQVSRLDEENEEIGEVSGTIVDVQWEPPDSRVCTLHYKFDAALSMDGSEDGDYRINVWYADRAGNGPISPSAHEPISLSFTYDTIQPGGPAISSLEVAPGAFSPNGDGVWDNTEISFSLSISDPAKDASMAILIYDWNRIPVMRFSDSDLELRPDGRYSIRWDGGDGGPEPLSDGTYLIKIDAKDDLERTGAMESSSVIIDTVPPSVGNLRFSNNPFTPDGDGLADTTTVSFLVSGSEPIVSGFDARDAVIVTIHDQSMETVASTILGSEILASIISDSAIPGGSSDAGSSVSALLKLNRSFTGDGEYSVTWNGDGADADGEYIFTITASDTAANKRQISGTVSLDKTGPSIQVSSPSSDFLITNEPSVLLSGSATDWSGVRSVWLTGIFTPSGAKTPVDDPISAVWVETTLSKAQEANTVNWTYRLVPQTDGEYLIKFRASDLVNHTLVSPKVLRVAFDGAAPSHRHTIGMLPPSEDPLDVPRVKNGDLLTVLTTWDQPGYSINMDFSQLDSTFGEPVEAEDQGDGSYMVGYKVSEENTQSDGLKTVVMTAEDAAGNKTELDTFRVKLRNKLPVIVSVASPDDRAAFANGASVLIEVECDAPDFSVFADFSELDSEYTPGEEKVTDRGDNTYLVEYQISRENTLPDRQNVLITISVSDGVELVSSQYKEISLDNTAPQILKALVKQEEVTAAGEDNVFSTDAAFANGNLLSIEATWDGPGYVVSADFSELDSTYRSGAEQVEEPEQDQLVYTYTISYKLDVANNMPDGEKEVVMRAVDPAGNVGECVLLIGLDNTAPSILSVASMDEDNLYKNGDTVTLLVKLDAPGYEVSGDFSALDSRYSERMKEVSVSDNGDGTYTLKYTISKDNTKALSDTVSNISITVAAADSVGNTSADSSVVVELDNFPPKLEIESPASDVLVNTAWIEIKGQTEPGAQVTVKPKPVAQASLPVDKDGRFELRVALNIGDNVVTVTATDAAGNQTIAAFTIVYRPLIRAAEGGTIYLPERKDDGIEGNDTRVVVPAGAAGEDFSIEITQLESAPPAVDNPDIVGEDPLVAYEFALKDETGNRPISTAFTKPIRVYLQYQGLSRLDGPAVVFRWDGVRWNRIGGVENRENDTVEITVNSLSIFAVFEGAVVPTEFRLDGARPNPFTPNSDGANDVVSFYFGNPNNGEAMIRIFDLRGALVRKLENGLTSWDGLDDAGQPVEMGVYIYQIEVENKVKGGTIVLAR